MHKVVDLKVLYFGTPVLLIGSRNPDGSANLAPMSSAWWLGQNCMLGLGNRSQTAANLRRERQCVLNLVPASLVDAIDRIALTTGAPVVPPGKAAQGYRFEPDKFGIAGLTEQPGELIDAPRVAECPIQLECEIVGAHPFGAPDPRATAFEARAVRVHIEQDLIIPGTGHVDPHRWDPLIMKFCEFFGEGVNLRSSRLAGAWQMPHQLRPAPLRLNRAANLRYHHRRPDPDQRAAGEHEPVVLQREGDDSQGDIHHSGADAVPGQPGLA